MKKDIFLAALLALLFYIFGILTSISVVGNVPHAVESYVDRLRAIRAVEMYHEKLRRDALRDLYQYMRENEFRET